MRFENTYIWWDYAIFALLFIILALTKSCILLIFKFCKIRSPVKKKTLLLKLVCFLLEYLIKQQAFSWHMFITIQLHQYWHIFVKETNTKGVFSIMFISILKKNLHLLSSGKRNQKATYILFVCRCLRFTVQNKRKDATYGYNQNNTPDSFKSNSRAGSSMQITRNVCIQGNPLI